MIQLHPKETFTIVRQIEDHTDSGTYYVQAVVRNAKTDVLLATVNLDNKGSRRFSKNYIVPADPSGEGLWITILTSVYTDSGYTTKSQNYADKMESYLVQARPVFNPNYPVPVDGGPEFDYKKIRLIIAEEIKKIKSEDNFNISDFEPFIKILRTDLKSIDTKIDKNKPSPINLEPILANIKKEIGVITGQIKLLDKPERYSELSDKLSNIETMLNEDKKDDQQEPKKESIDLEKLADSIYRKSTDRYEKALQIESKFKELMSMVEGIKTENPDNEEQKKLRINKLMKK